MFRFGGLDVYTKLDSTHLEVDRGTEWLRLMFPQPGCRHMWLNITTKKAFFSGIFLNIDVNSDLNGKINAVLR